jgi:hypothetical protein
MPQASLASAPAIKEEDLYGSSNFAVGTKFYTENEQEPGKPALPPSWLGFRNVLDRSPK